jgi:Ca2+-dependent lipid-binding protein
VQVEVWDWDRFTANDLIGQTTIDLEDRWYDEKWHAYGVSEVRSLLLSC